MTDHSNWRLTQGKTYYKPLLPSEDEDELVSHDLVLRDEIVATSGLHAELEGVHWSHLGRVGLTSVKNTATSLYDNLVGPD